MFGRLDIPHWKVTFHQLEAAFDIVSIWTGDLKRSGSSATPLGAQPVMATVQAPCPDERGSAIPVSDPGDYWGDYDRMIFNPASCTFTRPFTDSTLGCEQRTAFDSRHQHVSALELPCQSPDNNRRVTINYHLWINDDDEPLNSDECRTFGFHKSGCSESGALTATCDVSPSMPSFPDQEVFSDCVDDEVTGAVRLSCGLGADASTVTVILTATNDEGTSCSGGNFTQRSKTFVVAAGASVGDDDILAEQFFPVSNGSPYDRTQIILPTGAITNGLAP